jgi:hypothetical protein
MAMIPNAFTQRGVPGGDSRSGSMLAWGTWTGSSPGRAFSASRAALARDDVVKGRLAGSVITTDPTVNRRAAEVGAVIV